MVKGNAEHSQEQADFLKRLLKIGGINQSAYATWSVLKENPDAIDNFMSVLHFFQSSSVFGWTMDDENGTLHKEMPQPPDVRDAEALLCDAALFNPNEVGEIRKLFTLAAVDALACEVYLAGARVSLINRLARALPAVVSMKEERI